MIPAAISKHSASPARRGGFTLIELSIVLAIIALVVAMGVGMGSSMIDSAKVANTNNKLDAIETTLYAYRMEYDRLPCPTDATIAEGSAGFGMESANAGTCTGAPGPNATATVVAAANSTVVEGAVPVRTLNLPDEFQMDGWGRKFSYAVWTPMTAVGAFVNYGISQNCGAITVNSASGAAKTSVADYALISYGPDGHGGYSQAGGRYFMGSDNGSSTTLPQPPAGASEWTNCHCNATADTGYAATYVQKDATQDPTDALDTFDNIVRYKERWQLQNQYDGFSPNNGSCVIGFRIDGGGYVDYYWGDNNLYVVGIGDVNGDGIPDLVLAALNWWDGGGSQVLFVIFGTSNVGSPVWPIPPTGLDPEKLNGTNGFIIAYTSTPGGCGNCNVYSASVADVNGDGYADIIINGTAIVFGGPGGVTVPWIPGGGIWVNTSNLNGYKGPLNGYPVVNGTGSGNGSSGLIVTYHSGFWGGPSNVSSASFGMSDVDGDGYNDLIGAFTYDSGGAGFVFFGMSPTDWASVSSPLDITSLNGTNGFMIDHWLNGPLIVTDQNGVTGDLNGDNAYSTAGVHYGDILMYGTWNGPYLIYGRPRSGCPTPGPTCPLGDWQSALTTVNGYPVLNLSTELSATPNRATYFDCGGWYSGCMGLSMQIADVNNDGTPDVVGGANNSNPFVMYGKTDGSFWPASFNPMSPAPSQGFLIDFTGIPAWANAWGGYVVYAGDVTGSGKTDLIVNISASPLGRTNAGAYFVFLQPSGGWNTNSVSYSNFHWDGTDSFEIYGPSANTNCDAYGPNWFAIAANVRPEAGPKQKPEIILPCNDDNAIYGLYENNGWPAVVDLANWY